MTPSQQHRKDDGLPFIGAQPAIIRLRTTKFDRTADPTHCIAFDSREFFDPAGFQIPHAATALFNHFMSKHAGDANVWGQIMYFPAIDSSGVEMEKSEHLVFSGAQAPVSYSVSGTQFTKSGVASVSGQGFKNPVDWSGITASVTKRYRDAFMPKP